MEETNRSRQGLVAKTSTGMGEGENAEANELIVEDISNQEEELFPEKPVMKIIPG